MSLRWTKHRGPILHEEKRKDGVVEAKQVQKAGPGDLDLSRMEVWKARHGGFSYIIAFDPLHDVYVASCRHVSDLGKRFVTGDEKVSPTHWLCDRSVGVRTFTAAERLCEAHARGRRDA